MLFRKDGGTHSANASPRSFRTPRSRSTGRSLHKRLWMVRSSRLWDASLWKRRASSCTPPVPKPPASKPKKPKKPRALRQGVTPLTAEEKLQRASDIQAQTGRSMSAAMQALGTSSATPMVTSAPPVSTPTAASAKSNKPRAKPPAPPTRKPSSARSKRFAASDHDVDDDEPTVGDSDDDDTSDSDDASRSSASGGEDDTPAAATAAATGPRAHLRRHGKSAKANGVNLAERRDSYHSWRNLSWKWPEVLFDAGKHGLGEDSRAHSKIQEVVTILQELETEAVEQHDDAYANLFCNYRSAVELWVKGEAPQPDRDFFNA